MVLDIDNTVDVVARHKSLINVQTTLSQKADYRVTMEFNPLTAVPAI